ncbi:GPW/gp25 family protein [Mastigocoleus testarum]|uniref:Baseplate protein n=1 Tax=Mastigocoleus testarum BC008 TaxID=371196 RepID=A0A0V7ZWP7_9CYAN|nr:GPW/gp25 family protein [Mastigocoleus testarum]KST68646.1 baseplate protein [Mastigocoleus testarum BC008]
MDDNFLGVGLAFPIELDENNQLKISRYEMAVQQSIWTILGTAKGERIMRPDFGCGIHDFVFSANSASTVGQIVSEVRQSLIEWEPRIDILDVDVTPDEDEDSKLLIIINYRVRTTNNRFNLVYPFYLI